MKKNIICSLLISFVFSSSLASLQATTIANRIEMGLALATIPFDIVAQRNDFNDFKKTAAQWHLTTDAISIAGKLFFFYNNYQAQQRVAVSLKDQRDCIVNGAWLARDITRFYQHWKQYQTAQDVVVLSEEPIENDDIFSADEDVFILADATQDDPFMPFDEMVTDVKSTPSRPSRLAKFCQVVVLPMLRGLSACALAYTQDEASRDFDCEQGRFLATSAHSLTRLAEEYAELDAGSAYKKILAMALIAHTVWLYKEIQDFTAYKISPLARERRQLVHERRQVHQVQNRLNELLAMPQVEDGGVRGECGTCMGDDMNLVSLNCGHATACRDCLRLQINQEMSMDGRGVAELRCPVPGCRHQITDEEVRTVVGNDREFLQQFLIAGLPLEMFDAPYCSNCFLQHPDTMACEVARNRSDQNDVLVADELVRQGARICPGANCGTPVLKNNGCNYVRCNYCRYEFCWACLRACPNHQMIMRNRIPFNPCGCYVFDRDRPENRPVNNFDFQPAPAWAWA